MSEGIANNNPKKELLYTLGGIALFLGIVLIIGVSALLRPAGEHITAEATKASIATDKAEAIAAEDKDTVPAETPSMSADTDAVATNTPADATVTPAAATGDDSAVVAAQSGTATASGTVSQTAVADADLTAEQADADLDAGTDDKAVSQ